MKNKLFVYFYYALLFYFASHGSLNAREQMILNDMIQKAFVVDQKLLELTELHKMQINLSQAKSELPNLTMSLAAKNLPVDNFELSQEPMTQMAIGFTQKFPGGNKRILASKMERDKANVITATIRHRKKQIALTINQLWLDNRYLHRLNELLQEQKQVLNNLLSVTQSLYSVGKMNQQDVFKAEVEIESINEQLIGVKQNILLNHEGFGRWLNQIDLQRVKVEQYPNWSIPEDIITLRSRLLNHPLLAIEQQQVNVEKTALKIAQESNSNDWSVGMSYSNRSGNNFDSSHRSDLISINFSMDLPYFSNYRNNKTIQANQNQLQSAHYNKKDKSANLKQALGLSWKKYQSIEKRLSLFEDRLLPKSEQYKQAALNSYQRDVTDFNNPMQALIQDLQLKRQFEMLKREYYQEQANIIYLAGEQ